jgi:hypothetical protein
VVRVVGVQSRSTERCARSCYCRTFSYSLGGEPSFASTLAMAEMWQERTFGDHGGRGVRFPNERRSLRAAWASAVPRTQGVAHACSVVVPHRANNHPQIHSWTAAGHSLCPHQRGTSLQPQVEAIRIAGDDGRDVWRVNVTAPHAPTPWALSRETRATALHLQ